jgi:hypothetical protein
MKNNIKMAMKVMSKIIMAIIIMASISKMANGGNEKHQYQ